MIPENITGSRNIFGALMRTAGEVAGKAAFRKTRQPADTVYVMCPMFCYDTPHYDRSVDQIRRQVTAGKFILPSGLWKSNQDWLTRWPALSKQVTKGVMFGESGTDIVGKGVVSEVETLQERHVPVYWLKNDGTLTDQFRFELRNSGLNWKKYAVIRNSTF